MLDTLRLSRGEPVGGILEPPLLVVFPEVGRAVPAPPGNPKRAGNSDAERAFDVATDDAMMATVAGRYAAALFDLAKENGKLAEVEGDLGNMQSLLDMSDELRLLVASPLYATEDQTRAIAEIAAKAGASDLTVNFLKLIAKNRRLAAVGDMIKNFRALAARNRGEVSAEVTSATALGEEHLNELREALKASVGKDVQLVTRVDPSLLGGLIVKIGSRMIDSSLRTKLAGMRVSLRGTA